MLPVELFNFTVSTLVSIYDGEKNKWVSMILEETHSSGLQPYCKSLGITETVCPFFSNFFFTSVWACSLAKQTPQAIMYCNFCIGFVRIFKCPCTLKFICSDNIPNAIPIPSTWQGDDVASHFDCRNRCDDSFGEACVNTRDCIPNRCLSSFHTSLAGPTSSDIPNFKRYKTIAPCSSLTWPTSCSSEWSGTTTVASWSWKCPSSIR